MSIPLYSTPNEIIKELSKHGLYFKTLKLEVFGEYAPEDAAYNYADIPHHDHIHDVMHDKDIVINDHIVSKIRVQKILPFIKVIFLVLGYKYAKHKLLSYFNFAGIHIVNEVIISSNSHLLTKVESHYHVGMPFVLLWLRPLINLLLKRNFIRLSEDDLPLRERRGDLRKVGCEFNTYHDALNYGPSYPQTQEIDKDNVILTKKYFSNKEKLSVDLKEIGNNMVFLGTNVFGVQLKRIENKIYIYPRLCLHEGASLDKAKMKNTILLCPWHGRMIHPCITYDINTKQINYLPNNKYYSMTVDNEIINVSIQHP